MIFDVHLSATAQEDLDGIFDYIAITLSAPKAAIDWMNKVEYSFRDLSVFPEMFAQCQEEPWLLRNVRIMPVDNYKFFYHVDYDEQRIVILRVLSFRQDASTMI